MKKNPIKKIISLSIVVIVLFIIMYVEEEMINGFNSEIEESSSNLIIEQSKVSSSINDLNIVNVKLQENLSLLEELKSGDEYNLHDPICEEVLNFIEQDSSSDLKEMIDNAKNQGIRCAYVMVYVGGLTITSSDGSFSSSIGSGMHPLIGFDTVDQGMLYYETDTGYQVIPVVGEVYTDCVVGDPYLPGIFDNITNILEIW